MRRRVAPLDPVYAGAREPSSSSSRGAQVGGAGVKRAHRAGTRGIHAQATRGRSDTGTTSDVTQRSPLPPVVCWYAYDYQNCRLGPGLIAHRLIQKVTVVASVMSAQKVCRTGSSA